MVQFRIGYTVDPAKVDTFGTWGFVLYGEFSLTQNQSFIFSITIKLH